MKTFFQEEVKTKRWAVWMWMTTLFLFGFYIRGVSPDGPADQIDRYVRVSFMLGVGIVVFISTISIGISIIQMHKAHHRTAMAEQARKQREFDPTGHMWWPSAYHDTEEGVRRKADHASPCDYCDLPRTDHPMTTENES